MLDERFKVVFGACLTQFTVIGILFTYGLFFIPLQDEFGWSRTFLSSAASLSFLMMGVLAVLAGRMNDRFGPRIVMGICGVAYGVGYLLLSQVTAQWQVLIIFGTFIGLGLGAHDVVTLSTIARWFEKRRGIMSGVVKTGTAIGQVAMPPIAAYLLLAFGWRHAFIVLGIGAIITLVIASSFMSRPPQASISEQEKKSEGLSFSEARESRVFWSLCAIQFMFFPAMMTVPTHLAVHGMDLGMTTAKAATLLSVLGTSSIAGRLSVGLLADRIGSKRSFLMCFAVLLGSLIAFVGVTSHGPLFAVVVFYGFSHGGLFTVVSLIVAEYYGMRSHGSIFGTILFFGTIGGAIGPILAGWIFDVYGSYQYAFLLLAVMAAVGLALVMSLPGKSKAREV